MHLAKCQNIKILQISATFKCIYIKQKSTMISIQFNIDQNNNNNVAFGGTPGFISAQNVNNRNIYI